MDVKEAIIKNVNEVFLSFGLTAQLQSEKEEPDLISAEQVNILAGFTNVAKGTVVLGLNKDLALQIVAAMMRSGPVAVLDEVGKSGLTEILTMIIGNAFGVAKPEIVTTISPPTLVIGNNIFLILNRLKSHKLLFNLNGNPFSIAYCIEQ